MQFQNPITPLRISSQAKTSNRPDLTTCTPDQMQAKDQHDVKVNRCG
jgi:hypothetical protein